MLKKDNIDIHQFKNIAAIKNILPQIISSKQSDFTLNEGNCYKLFETSCKDWEYIDYYALDKTNGQPYFVHDVVKSVGAAWGSDMQAKKISYEKLRNDPKCPEKYKEINESNWCDFIPKESNKEGQNKAVDIGEDVISHKDTYLLERFYYEIHNYHFHLITYLRKTNDGYRVFYVSSRGWHYGLKFNFDMSENMIKDIILNHKYGYDFDAFDRLLSERETDYIMGFFASQESGKNKSDTRDECYMLYNESVMCEKSERTYAFKGLLIRLAEYGSFSTK